MPMEIRAEGEGASLGPMQAPRPARSGLDAFLYTPEALNKLQTTSGVYLRQEDVPAGKAAGLRVELYFVNPAKRHPNVVKLDTALGAMFSSLGYQLVAPGALSTEGLGFEWRFESDSNTYSPYCNAGPTLLRDQIIGQYVYDRKPTAADTNLVSRNVQVYRLRVRPSGAMNDVALAAARNALSTLLRAQKWTGSTDAAFLVVAPLEKSSWLLAALGVVGVLGAYAMSHRGA